MMFTQQKQQFHYLIFGLHCRLEFILPKTHVETVSDIQNLIHLPHHSYQKQWLPV